MFLSGLIQEGEGGSSSFHSFLIVAKVIAQQIHLARPTITYAL